MSSVSSGLTIDESYFSEKTTHVNLQLNKLIGQVNNLIMSIPRDKKFDHIVNSCGRIIEAINILKVNKLIDRQPIQKADLTNMKFWFNHACDMFRIFGGMSVVNNPALEAVKGSLVELRSTISYADKPEKFEEVLGEIPNSALLTRPEPIGIDHDDWVDVFA